MRFKFNIIFIFFTSFIFCQQNANDTIKNKEFKIFGGIESNSQWYQNDKERLISQPSNPLRSNNYLLLNSNYGNFSAGIQIETYESKPLLNYNPEYNGTNVGTFYLKYKNRMFDITIGHFYEQFGSGLLFRTWEDRALGINNSLRGLHFVFSPTENLSFTSFYGKQRSGFAFSDSDIYGFKNDFNLSHLLKDNFDLSLQTGIILKDESIKNDIINPQFSRLTKGYFGRINFAKNNFYLTFEQSFKDREPILFGNNLNYDFVKNGQATLLNFGYSKKGFGFDSNLRRIENMLFLSERLPTVYAPEVNSLFFNDKILNFVPALTKQHHSNLANIYVYQAQNRVIMQFDENIQKFGEIGGQFDLFFNAKKGTAFGGKYGTKFSLNFSSWFNLDTNYSYENELGEFIPNYSSKYFAFNEKYFSDINFEVSKKITSNFKGILMYSNQFYNDQYIRGISQENVIRSNILFFEGIYNFSKNRAVSFATEHMWADNDRGNWLAFSLEYNHGENWSFFISDMYNYGFDTNSSNILISGNVDKFDIHFYNLGLAYRKGSTRISLNYGRQRGGLVCAGGVCRFVPPSTGLGLNLTKSF